MKKFFSKAAYQKNPLRVLGDFLEQEESFKKAKSYEEMRFVGYPIKIGYEEVTIITSDPYKIAVGGVPRNSLLIMVPTIEDKYPPHLTLLRVLEASPTPLDREVQQTYFELHKKSMPELDVFTQSELQWGSFKAAVLGMFYPNPDDMNKVEFSGDLNNFVSPHKYLVFAPDDDLLDLIINSMVPEENRFPIGKLRMTECRLPLPDNNYPDVDVFVSTKDFMGTRTAMFGKTRLGKSNVVKLIAESLIETTKDTNNVGQLIFDMNGEYANDNPQDDNYSLASAYPEECVVYALAQKSGTPSKPLKLNFYVYPDRGHEILSKLLEMFRKIGSKYVENFTHVDIPSLERFYDSKVPRNEKVRIKRKFLMFWAVLYSAGFDINESELIKIIQDKFASNSNKRVTKRIFDPGYSKGLRGEMYKNKTPPKIDSLKKLTSELKRIAQFIRNRSDDEEHMKSSSGREIFESDERAILKFLKPSTGIGPAYLLPYRMYHDEKAEEFMNEIVKLIDNGKTVILDLGNAHPKLMSFYSDELSKEIFTNQVEKFTENKIGNHYVQLYFEEAHNLFPKNQESEDIYLRLAKEGAKYHIGMVYSTQSITTINQDLLAQTENFFIAHLSSENEVNALARLNVAYTTLKEDILRAKTVGYIRMLSRSHRFVISVQARKFTPSNTE